MTALYNNAEGGTNGTTVTTLNSGGTSGTAWDSILTGGSSTAIFDNTHARDSLSYKVTNDGTNTIYLSWSSSLGTVSEAWGRAYIYLTANPASGSLGLIRGRNGTSQCFRISVNTSGQLEIRQANNSLLVTSTASLTLNQFTRIEWHCVPLSSNGTIEAKIFNTTDSSTATETITSTTATLLTNLTDINYGVQNTGVSVWFDHLNVNTTAYPGPSGQSLTGTGIASGEAFGTAVVTIGSVTVSPSGIASSGALGSATVTPGSVSVAPTGVASGEAYGLPTVTTAGILAPTSVSSSEAFGTTTVTPGGVTVFPTPVGSSEAFGAPQVGTSQLVEPDPIASSEAFGITAVQQAYLHPPVVREGPVADGPLFGRYKLYRAMSIVQWSDSSWSLLRYPAQEDLETALRVYLGGRKYPLSADDVTVLTSAGFSSYIITE